MNKLLIKELITSRYTGLYGAKINKITSLSADVIKTNMVK